MAYAAFHARVTGRTHFKAAEVPAVIREVPDLRLCDYLLEGTGYIAVACPVMSDAPHQNVVQMAAEGGRRALDLVESIGGSEAGHPLPETPARLADQVKEMERSVSRLRGSIGGPASDANVRFGWPPTAPNITRAGLGFDDPAES